MEKLHLLESENEMITKEQAIIEARKRVNGLIYVNPEKILVSIFSSREEALAAGVRDGESVRDSWLISFERIKTGNLLDGLFDHLLVSVDAETGEATIIENL